jgi:hypothetical protein
MTGRMKNYGTCERVGEAMRLKIEPEFELAWSRDLFGNCVATADLLSPADRLRIHNEVILHQMAPFPKRSVRRDTPVRFPVQFSEMESAVAGAYLASSYPTDVAKVKELGTILLIILVLLLGGALPTWPYSSGWGYYPMGGLGLLLIIVLVLVLLGRV